MAAYSMTTPPPRVEWPDMAVHLEFNTSMSNGLGVLGAAGIVIPAFARARITPEIR